MADNMPSGSEFRTGRSDSTSSTGSNNAHSPPPRRVCHLFYITILPSHFQEGIVRGTTTTTQTNPARHTRLVLPHSLRGPPSPEAPRRPRLHRPPPEHERAAAQHGLHRPHVEQVRSLFTRYHYLRPVLCRPFVEKKDTISR